MRHFGRTFRCSAGGATGVSHLRSGENFDPFREKRKNCWLTKSRFLQLLYVNAFLKKLAPVWTPHEGQREFLVCRNKIRVLACGRRWGKTDACAVAILSEMFGKKETRHLILAPTLDQAKLLFDRVRELLECVNVALLDSGELHPPAPSSFCRDAKGRWAKSVAAQNEEGELDDTSARRHLHPPAPSPSRQGEGEFRIKVSNSPYPKLTFGKHTVVARSGHVGRSLRGNEATHVIVDEAAFVPEALVTEVAMPMLATNNGRLTLISTPNGLNHFWKFFQMGINGEHGVWSRTAPSSESPHVSKSFLKVQRELISERAYQIEYEADFVDLVGSVFSGEAIEECSSLEPMEVEGSICGGVDWGRYKDYTAVAVVQGTRQAAQVRELQMFRQHSWPDMVGRAAQIFRRFSNIFVSGDGTGNGDSVTAMLREELGKPVECVVFTNARKQQLIDGLKTLLERRALRFEPNPELIKQLKHFETKVSASGNQIMNARSGYHDDLVIALALACEKLVSGYSALVMVGDVRVFSRRSSGLRFEDLRWDEGQRD